MRTACAVLHVVLIMYLTTLSALAQGNIPKEVSRKYPEDRHIIRSGTGETPESASESARFEIAKYFESKISGETLVHQWAQTTTSRGKTMESQLAEVSNTVIVSASRDIPGVEIAANKRNKKLKAYEAWAVLEKSMYANILRERLNNIDSGINEKLSRIEDSDLNRVRIY